MFTPFDIHRCVFAINMKLRREMMEKGENVVEKNFLGYY